MKRILLSILIVAMLGCMGFISCQKEVPPITTQSYNLELVNLARQIKTLKVQNQNLQSKIGEQARDIWQLRRELTTELVDAWGSRSLKDFRDKEELMKFLMEDKTDQMAYDDTGDYKYVCSHYAFQLMRNAADKGYRMYPVLIYALEGNHIMSLHMMNFAVVEMYLVPVGEYRRTMVGVEPMTDEIIILGSLYKDKELWRERWIPFLP